MKNINKMIDKLIADLKRSKEMHERGGSITTLHSFYIDDAIKLIKAQQGVIQSKDDEIKRLRSLLNICESDNKRLTEFVRHIESKINELR